MSGMAVMVSGKRRGFSRPRLRRLQCPRGAQHQRVAVHRADNLRGERQAIIVKAGADADAGCCVRVERVGERRPVEKLLDRHPIRLTRAP